MKQKKNNIAKYICKFAEPYKWSFVNAFLCIFFTSIISMIYPYIFGMLVDEVFYSKNFKFFIFIVIGYAIIYLTEQFLHLILNILWPYQYNVYLLEVRKTIYRKIMSLKYDRLTKMTVGDLVGKINWQADAFVELIHRNLAYLISNSIKLCAILVIVCLIDYRISILLFVSTIVSYFISYKLGKRIGKQQKKVQDDYISFIGWIYEIIGGIRDIKLFGVQKNTFEKFEQQIDHINEGSLLKAKSELLSDRFCSLIALLTNILLYVASVYLIYYDKISLGQIIAIITYFEISNTLLDDINWYWGNVHSNTAIIRNVVELLEMESEEIQNYPNIEIKEGRVEFDSVTFSYDNKNKVLKDMKFEIAPGEKVAFVGRSGVGKSTVANLLLRLINADRGIVKIDQQNVATCSLHSLREQVGIVQQEIFIFDGSIRMNLIVANPKASEQEIQKAVDCACLREYITSLKDGLDTIIGHEGINMSGGEKQRIAIARLFLKHPKIVIFDEATSALDTQAEYEVNHAWTKLSKGRTTIIIAHRLSTILDADKIAILNDGHIAGYGKQNDLYKTLFEEQYLLEEKINHNDFGMDEQEQIKFFTAET